LRSRTIDFCAASRASATCAVEATTDAASCGRPSKIPKRNMMRRMRRTASSIVATGTSPASTAASSRLP
jgi:hypothetical protein